MSFSPIIPANGLGGWQFLQRTMEKQATSHSSTAIARRDEAYFLENIGKIGSAEELVKDRRMLRITLSAFGLAEDLQNRAFIQRVFESPTGEQAPGEKRSFVQRLADKRYYELAKAFGFGDRTNEREQNLSGQTISIAGRDTASTRFTASMQRDLAAFAGSDIGEEAKWTLIINTPSLRAMFETAYELPDNFDRLPQDDQISALRKQTEKIFGSDLVAQFAGGKSLDKLSQRYIDGFASDLLQSFHARQFEEAVGQQNQSMRMALALQRDLGQLAGGEQSESGKWFRILGTPSMRKVFETAFQLPSSFGSLDLDRQVDILRGRTQRAFGDGNLSQFSDPEKMNKLVRQFFIGEQLSDMQSMNTSSTALMLLQSGQASLSAILGPRRDALR